MNFIQTQTFLQKCIYKVPISSKGRPWILAFVDLHERLEKGWFQGGAAYLVMDSIIFSSALPNDYSSIESRVYLQLCADWLIGSGANSGPKWVGFSWSSSSSSTLAFNSFLLCHLPLRQTVWVHLLQFNGSAFNVKDWIDVSLYISRAPAAVQKVNSSIEILKSHK